MRWPKSQCKAEFPVKSRETDSLVLLVWAGHKVTITLMHWPKSQCKAKFPVKSRETDSLILLVWDWA